MSSHELWERLSLEGHFDLIDKLSRAEKGEGGFGVIVVPLVGFSEDDATHNMVLDWLEEHGIQALNVELEVARMTCALKGYQEE